MCNEKILSRDLQFLLLIRHFFYIFYPAAYFDLPTQLFPLTIYPPSATGAFWAVTSSKVFGNTPLISTSPHTSIPSVTYAMDSSMNLKTDLSSVQGSCLPIPQFEFCLRFIYFCKNLFRPHIYSQQVFMPVRNFSIIWLSSFLHNFHQLAMLFFQFCNHHQKFLFQGILFCTQLFHSFHQTFPPVRVSPVNFLWLITWLRSPSGAAIYWPTSGHRFQSKFKIKLQSG